MKSQHTIFKWIAIPIVLALFLSSALVSPSVSAQDEVPPTSTETPTEISPEGTPFPTIIATPTIEEPLSESPSLLQLQSLDEPVAPLSTDWSTPFNLSVTDTDSIDPSIATDSIGGVHVVWSEQETGGKPDVYYTFWKDQIWSTPINVSASEAFGSTRPQVIADSSGRAHIVWEEQDDDYANDVEIMYSRCEGETCTSPVSLSGPPNWDCGIFGPNLQDWYSEEPIISIDQSDKLMVVWEAFEPGQVTQPYSSWLASGTPPSKPTGCVPLGGSTVYDRYVGAHRVSGGLQDDFRVVFEEERTGGIFEIYYSRYTNGFWTSPLRLATGSLPDLFLDASTQAHVTWCAADRKLKYWNSNNNITEDVLPATCYGNAPITVDSTGMPRVFWEQGGQVYISECLPEGWSEAVNITQSSGGAYKLDVVADTVGNLHTLWQDLRDGNLEIYYATTAISCATDIFEPDNIPSAGSTLIMGEDPQRHSLCPQSDEDWANFQVSTTRSVNGNLLVETFDLDPDDIFSNSNTEIIVSDESINQIGKNRDRGYGPFPGSSQVVDSSRVVWHPATGGVFNIKVIPQEPINEQEGSGYSLRLTNPLTLVDPVDQGSWAPTKVNVPFVTRSGNAIYFTQFFTYEQAELDALNAVRGTLAWEFRRPEVDTDTGLERDESNLDYGDYWQNVNGVCKGQYWTNLPSTSDEFVEESNSPGGCQSPYFNNPLAPDNEEFELYVDKTSQLVAGKVYYITIKFYIHEEYLNNNYQFYISKVEYCESVTINEIDYYDVICNVLPNDSVAKLTANLIEGYLQPVP